MFFYRPFSREGNWATDNGSGLPKATQLGKWQEWNSNLLWLESHKVIAPEELIRTWGRSMWTGKSKPLFQGQAKCPNEWNVLWIRGRYRALEPPQACCIGEVGSEWFLMQGYCFGGGRDPEGSGNGGDIHELLVVLHTALVYISLSLIFSVSLRGS